MHSLEQLDITMFFLREGKTGGKVVPINSGMLPLSSMLSKAGKNSLQAPLLNPKQILWDGHLHTPKPILVEIRCPPEALQHEY